MVMLPVTMERHVFAERMPLVPANYWLINLAFAQTTNAEVNRYRKFSKKALLSC